MEAGDKSVIYVCELSISF